MYLPFEIGPKKFLISPYTTKQERDFLLLSSFDVDDFERIFELLDYKSDISIKDLSLNEQRVLLYRFRDISLGDEVEVNFQCDKCKHHNENVILNTSNFLIMNIRDDNDIIKKNKEVTDDNLSEFVPNIDVDELNIDEFDKLKERVKDNQIRFDFIKEVKCVSCSEIKKFDMSSPKYIIEILSDDNLMTLYKTINSMVIFGSYTKEDIDNMIPFERTILAGLLKTTKEDMIK